MRRRCTGRSGVLAAAIVTLAAGAAMPAATADAQRGSGGERGHYDEGGWGTLCIGRSTHEFSFAGSPACGIVDAFRSCGYDAWISKGSIVVRYHGHRPRFTLRVPGYSFGVRYDRGCVVITPKCLAPPPRATIRYRVRDTWGSGDACPPPRHAPGPRWGWQVQWSWGHQANAPKHRGWYGSGHCR